jgi:hypothetical protein
MNGLPRVKILRYECSSDGHDGRRARETSLSALEDAVRQALAEAGGDEGQD